MPDIRQILHRRQHRANQTMRSQRALTVIRDTTHALHPGRNLFRRHNPKCRDKERRHTALC